MNMIDGIIIGGAGGAVAGVTVWIIQLAYTAYYEWRDKRRILNWFDRTSQHADSKWEYRSTRAIASYTNLTQDRVRYICSSHTKIRLSIGPKDDMWGLVED